jgi:uncharacterized membrane-anchored protein YitT (DUF2179 family)
MAIKKMTFISAVAWNLILLTGGAAVLALGIKAVAIPHGFISGGFSGLSLLIYYVVGKMSPGIWYFILNIPLFALGWIFLSRRFFFYSLYGMLALTLFIDLISFQIPIHDKLLSALAGGTLVGAGAGIYLHSLGSAGGTDIIAIILNQKLNVRIGSFFFFNLVLFSFSFAFLDVELILYSLVLTFVVAQVTDSFLSVFNQRKMVIIISNHSDRIADEIMNRLDRGSTFLYGRGAYSGQRKKVLLTVINNYQLKRLEEIVFGIDVEAFCITENTFNVLGKGFSKRKIY